jgi:hypothetical protein
MLRDGHAAPIQLRRLLAELHVDFTKEVDPKREGSGELRKAVHGGYQIVLFRAHAEPRPLKPRERFTVAHELGHLLLEERYQWRPATSAEYHRREDYCNQFAAHLLVPTGQLEQLLLPSPAAALGLLFHTSETCRVSFEVAARRIADYYEGIAYLLAAETKNKRGEQVFISRWSAGLLGQAQIPRGKHLRDSDPIGGLLLDLQRHPSHQKVFSLQNIGDGLIRQMDTGSLLVAVVAHAWDGQPVEPGSIAEDCACVGGAVP